MLDNGQKAERYSKIIVFGIFIHINVLTEQNNKGNTKSLNVVALKILSFSTCTLLLVLARFVRCATSYRYICETI
jgi:hypothetical protein